MWMNGNLIIVFLKIRGQIVIQIVKLFQERDEQLDLIENVYQERLLKEKFDLKEEQKELLKFWFGDSINLCRKSFSEIEITV